MVAAATAAGGSHAGVMPTVYDSRLRPQPGSPALASPSS